MSDTTRPELTRPNPTRSRLLRWSVPTALVAAAAIVASGVLAADATPPLPDKTAAQLLVELQSAHVDGLSGTVVQKSDLGLPELPDVGVRGSAALTSLLSGSNTLRVWYAGEDKQRVALLGTLGETDIIHNGRDAWVWSSEDNTAVHYRLPAASTRDHDSSPVPSPVTPQQAADQALRALDPTTAVTTDGTARVAGRSAYELVLRPRDTRSLVGQVRLAVDADAGVPLRVRIYPRAAGSEPAFEVGFTRISFARPGDEQFRFTPPPNAKVREKSLGAGPRAPDTAPKAPKAPPPPLPPSGATEQMPATVGTGWTTVAVIPGVQISYPARGGAGWEQFVDRLPRVSGDWGSGRLLTSKLVSALLTDDGRLVVGAVGPELLYAAARQR
jgi:outer membrane lipoprotein-sorting protein